MDGKDEYELTFTVIIEELGDHEAKNRARKIAEAIGEVVEVDEVELQQVCQDQTSRGVSMS